MPASRFKLAFLCLVLSLAGYSCQATTSMAPKRPVRKTQAVREGMASWYGGAFHGRRTASGEVFDKKALTAAHRTLGFGTVVRVTNLRNGRSVDVRINDRGPYKRGRIIDLSEAAARRLGMIGRGVVPVRIRVLRRP